MTVVAFQQYNFIYGRLNLNSCNFYVSQNVILLLSFSSHLKMEKTFLAYRPYKTDGGLDLAGWAQLANCWSGEVCFVWGS